MTTDVDDGHDVPLPGVAIGRYLDLIVNQPISDTNTEAAGELLHDVHIVLDRRPAECFRVFADLLSTWNLPMRHTAATLLVVFIEEGILMPVGPEVAEAKAVVAECLRGSNAEHQLRIAVILAQHSVPKDLIGPATRLLQRPGSELSIVASLALRRYPPEQLAEAERVERLQAPPTTGRALSAGDIPNLLRLGLGQDVPHVLRSNCASALLESEPMSSRLYSSALQVLEAVPPIFKVPVLAGIYKRGECSDEAFTHVVRLVDAEQLAPPFRLMAASTLGRVSVSAQPLQSATTKYHHSIPPIVEALVHGIGSKPVLDHAIVDLLAELASSPYRGVRVAALRALGSATPLPESALECVVRELERDDDHESAAAISEALLAAGEAAIPVLCVCGASGKPRLIAMVQTFVLRAPIPVILGLLRMCDEQDDPRLAGMLQAVFGLRGEECGALVPELLNRLDGTRSDWKNFAYLYGLAKANASGAEVVARAAARLSDSDNGVVEMAEAVLLDIGAAAVEPLHVLLSTSTAAQKQQVERVLLRLDELTTVRGEARPAEQPTVVPDDAFVKLCVTLGNDQLLRLFVLVARAMKGANGPCSLGEVSRTLADQQADGKIARELAVTKSSLSKAMTALEKHCGVELFDYTHGRAGTLKPDGEKLLLAAGVHLGGRG